MSDTRLDGVSVKVAATGPAGDGSYSYTLSQHHDRRTRSPPASPALTHIVTVTQAANGTITPPARVGRPRREPAFTITPATHYLSSLDGIVDGATTGRDGSTATRLATSRPGTRSPPASPSTPTSSPSRQAAGGSHAARRRRSTTAAARPSPSRQRQLPHRRRARRRRRDERRELLHLHAVQQPPPHDQRQLRHRHLHDHRHAGASGRSPDGTVSVDHGANQTFTITAAPTTTSPT